MLLTTVVTQNEELVQIHRLNRQNLKQELTADERKKEGFVTWLYSPELLQKMHQLAPAIIAKDNNKVVGYALTTLKESSNFHPDLQTMMLHLKDIPYENRLLSSFTFYCMGQICIDKNYRGRGIFSMLYEKHKEIYSKKYQLLVTEISTSNHRSLRAHEKTGFKTIHTYRDHLDEWNVVVWDWK